MSTQDGTTSKELKMGKTKSEKEKMRSELKSTLTVTHESARFTGQFKPEVITGHIIQLYEMFKVDIDSVEPKEFTVDIKIAKDGTLSFEQNLKKEDIPLFVYAMLTVLESRNSEKSEDDDEDDDND